MEMAEAALEPHQKSLEELYASGCLIDFFEVAAGHRGGKGV